MGRAKDEMMRLEALSLEARDIAVEAGVLLRCEYHPDFVWEHGADNEDAYKLANARFTRGEILTPCNSRRELTDAIKNAIEEAGIFGCPACANALRD